MILLTNTIEDFKTLRKILQKNFAKDSSKQAIKDFQKHRGKIFRGKHQNSFVALKITSALP